MAIVSQKLMTSSPLTCLRRTAMPALHVILWLVLLCGTAAVWETGNACRRGYYGSNCMEQCPINCSNNKCYMDGTCYTCTRGFHGPNCSKSCSSTCYNDTCEMNGDCVSCIFGFYGKECNISCHEDCVTCFSATQCGKCRSGFYGEDCKSRCPSNCITCTNGSYCYLCKVGYYGYTCDNTCSFCKDGTPCRQSDGYCLMACKDGYTSIDCRQKCHSNCRTCKRNKNTFCTACADGRFGHWFPPRYEWLNHNISYCLNQCSANCLHGLCNERTGHCFNCTGGFKGDVCDICREPLANPGKNCKCRTDLCLYGYKSNCVSCKNATWYPEFPEFLSWSCCPCSNTCRNSTCSKEDVCTHGCIDGYYGNGCKWRCSDRQEGCEKCTIYYKNRYICEKCKSGFYLTNNQCSKCSGYCLNNTCDPADGRCLEGCEDGHWGETCNGICDDHCEICENNTECMRCESGRYLTNCTGQCSQACVRVKGNLVCDIRDGSCIGGCSTERLYGKHCNLDCSENCRELECEWLSGNCRKGCVTGLYGEFCNNTCAGMCMPAAHVETKCYGTNGTCIAGCLNGYYGDTCREECSRNCINGTCDRDSGSCLLGCLPGYLGANCSQSSHEQSGPGATGALVHVFAVLGVVVLLLLVATGVVVIVFYMRRREKRQLRPQCPAASNTTPEEYVAMTEIDHTYKNVNDFGTDAQNTQRRVNCSDRGNAPLSRNTTDSAYVQVHANAGDTNKGADDAVYEQSDLDIRTAIEKTDEKVADSQYMQMNIRDRDKRTDDAGYELPDLAIRTATEKTKEKLVNSQYMQMYVRDKDERTDDAGYEQSDLDIRTAT